MLDEEKKAIEKIRNFNQYNWELNNLKTKKFAKPYFDSLDTILNLIEKQSKQIKELKENNRKYIVQLTDEQYRKLVDIIRNDINKEWIDKINFKIEELDETKQYWNNEVIKILNEIKGDDK